MCSHLNAVHREHVVLPLTKFELYDYDVFEDVWDDIDPLKARHSFFSNKECSQSNLLVL